MSARWTWAALLLLAGPACAQQSADFKLMEQIFNAGGHPFDGAILSSPGYRMTMDAVGENVGSRDLASASFHLDNGFVNAYPPPGEAHTLRFQTTTTLLWDPERSVGSYNVYRDLLSTLFAGDFGACFAQDLPTPTATDSNTPPANHGWFYLVTAANRLSEEGTKGFSSSGDERGNTLPCP